MLAGARFSDRPRCVDPVIAAYLRAFNDRLPHRDRQRLMPYAARVVGTRQGRRRRRERLRLCLAFAGLRSNPLARLRFGVVLGARWTVRLECGAGEYAARVAVGDDRVEAGFRLLDELIGGSEPAPLAGAVVLGPELGVPRPGAQLELQPH